MAIPSCLEELLDLGVHDRWWVEVSRRGGRNLRLQLRVTYSVAENKFKVFDLVHFAQSGA